MRRLILSFIALLPAALAAQRGDTLARDVVPRAMQQAVEARWNGKVALRSTDSVMITKEPTAVDGNVAVQNGPLVIAGRVAGNVLAVNSDVILRPGARIDGDLWVIGGRLVGQEYGAISGELRVYSRRVSAVRDGPFITISDEDDAGPRVRRRNRRAFSRVEDGSWSDPIHVASAGAYNRVEGLPVDIGPSIYQRTPWGSLAANAYAVIRTGSTFADDGGDVGHDITTELRFGQRTGPALGGRVYNTVDPVESWQLSQIETSLSAFLFRRDYRDYFANHGATGYGRFYLGRNASLTGSFSDERWGSRDLFNPFTLFRGDADWRPNPSMDVGRLHVGNVVFQYDTRTHPDEPRSGLYILMDAEHGAGNLTRAVQPNPLADPFTIVPMPTEESVNYTRGFLDARSYNRLSPSGQISFRVVAAGWLGGDRLPTQRRLSVEGPSVLPGYDFRSFDGGFQSGTCNAYPSPGMAAQCDRIALAQVEYRGAINFDAGDWREDAGRYIGARTDASWVMFFDAGRGWLVGTPTTDGSTYAQDKLPAFSTFRSDVGLGLDFGGLGLYAAKAVTQPIGPVNFYLRLHRRF